MTTKQLWASINALSGLSGLSGTSWFHTSESSNPPQFCKCFKYNDVCFFGQKYTSHTGSIATLASTDNQRKEHDCTNCCLIDKWTLKSHTTAMNTSHQRCCQTDKIKILWITTWIFNQMSTNRHKWIKWSAFISVCYIITAITIFSWNQSKATCLVITHIWLQLSSC